jgi:hypothetical protein
MKKVEQQEPRITLTCLEDDQCLIYFEPWGTELVLAKGDEFEVRSAAFATGDVEVSYLAGAIMLGFTSDDEITVTDRAGRRHPI